MCLGWRGWRSLHDEGHFVQVEIPGACVWNITLSVVEWKGFHGTHFGSNDVNSVDVIPSASYLSNIPFNVVHFSSACEERKV